MRVQLRPFHRLLAATFALLVVAIAPTGGVWGPSALHAQTVPEPTPGAEPRPEDFNPIAPGAPAAPPTVPIVEGGAPIVVPVAVGSGITVAVTLPARAGESARDVIFSVGPAALTGLVDAAGSPVVPASIEISIPSVASLPPLPNQGTFIGGGLEIVVRDAAGNVIEGVVFAEPVMLTLSYSAADLQAVGGNSAALVVLTARTAAGPWEILPTQPTNGASGQVTALVSHLSYFVLATSQATPRTLPTTSGSNGTTVVILVIAVLLIAGGWLFRRRLIV